MSTSLSVSGFMSLCTSDSGGMSKPSITFRISFQMRDMTMSFVDSLRYVLSVDRFASKKSNSGTMACSISTSVRPSGLKRGFSDCGSGICTSSLLPSAEPNSAVTFPNALL